MSTKIHDPKLQYDAVEHSSSRLPAAVGPAVKGAAAVLAADKKMSPKSRHLIAKSSPSSGRPSLGQTPGGRMTPETGQPSSMVASYQQHQHQFDKAKAAQLELHKSQSHHAQPKEATSQPVVVTRSQSQSAMWAKAEQAPSQAWSEAKTQPLQQWSKFEPPAALQAWSQVKNQPTSSPSASSSSQAEEHSPWSQPAVQGQSWSPSCAQTYKGT
ncbi:MAG: hypothetical protein GXO35_03000 [Gammaproteobacteria bacterium]|nr:hypothetical protein [Gammaproteobacteria bacterium]